MRIFQPLRFEIVKLKNQIVNAFIILFGNPVLVYQMGKVGSSSVYYSIRRMERSVLHLHRIPRWVGFFLRRKKNVYIISMVREPVGRRISGYFQNFRMHTGRYYDASADNVKEVVKEFLDNRNMWEVPEWLEHELLPVSGINVYERPFSREKGYEFYESGGLRLLLLRVELEDAFKESVIREFLQEPGFRLKRENEGLSKVYADTYREFKDSIQLPEEYLDRMYGSDYARHFYTLDELEQERQKWLTKVD